MRFPSTILSVKNDPKDIQRAELDLLDKINKVAASIPDPVSWSPIPAQLNGSNLRQIYTGTPATTPSVTEVDVSAYVDEGITAIYVYGGIQTGSNTYSYLAASKTNAANFDNGIWPAQGYGGAAFQYFPISGLIYLNADRKFWIYKSAAGITACELYIGSKFI